MYGYQAVPYAPPRRMAQAVVVPTTPVVPTTAGPTVPTPLEGAPVPQGLLWTALSGAAAWAAIRTAVRPKETTFMRVVGWSGGVAAGLAGLLGLYGVIAPQHARGFPLRWYWVV